MTDAQYGNPEEKIPPIEVSENGPYIARNIKRLRNSKGVHIETTSTVILCRCGKSGNKPFCDGTHASINFSGVKQEGRVPDKLDDYNSREITIHDNRGVCSHIGHCTDTLTGVCRMETEPWIDPDGASPDDIARVIRICPSGALSFSRDNVLYKDYGHEPEIFVAHNRPYHVTGGIELNDPDGNTPETKDHYTLCRCGHLKEQTILYDRSHYYENFEDGKN